MSIEKQNVLSIETLPASATYKEDARDIHDELTADQLECLEVGERLERWFSCHCCQS